MDVCAARYSTLSSFSGIRWMLWFGYNFFSFLFFFSSFHLFNAVHLVRCGVFDFYWRCKCWFGCYCSFSIHPKWIGNSVTDCEKYRLTVVSFWMFLNEIFRFEKLERNLHNCHRFKSHEQSQLKIIVFISVDVDCLRIGEKAQCLFGWRESRELKKWNNGNGTSHWSIQWHRENKNKNIYFNKP